MARFVLDHVSKSFPGAHGREIAALCDVSFTIEDRELAVVVGPSGSGKSTLLRLIAGLETPTHGTLQMEGRVINDLRPEDRDLAMVFPNGALFPHLSVRENLALGLKLRNLPRPEIDRRVLDAARLLGLEEHLERLPSTLSSGQRQRAALGRALARQPKAFLLDEPLSGLDGPLRTQLRGEIRRLHERLGATTLYVTHDQLEAMTLGQRLLVLNQGSLQQAADPLTVYHHPANRFVAGFIGSPPMNFLPGFMAVTDSMSEFVTTNPREVPAGHVRCPLDPGLASRLQTRPTPELTLGIRPEDLHETTPGPDFSGEVTGLVDWVELLGPDTYLHLNTGPHALVARVSSTTQARAGQPLTLAFDPRMARFFDPATGNAIY